MKKLILFTILATIATAGYAKTTSCSKESGIACISEFRKPNHKPERADILDKIPSHAQSEEKKQDDENIQNIETIQELK